MGYQINDPENESLASINRWINESTLLDWYNRLRLKAILKPLVSGENYYVQAAPNVGNTLYNNENPFSNPPYPDEGHRLLAIFRYWNIINYFYPYKNVIGENWEISLSHPVLFFHEKGWVIFSAIFGTFYLTLAPGRARYVLDVEGDKSLP